MIRLELKGHIPSKASCYRRGKHGNLYLPPGTAMEIAALQLQLNAQWHQREALEHPEVTVRFTLQNDAQDRDGALKTALDLMQAGGVIKNDNIRHANGWLHIAPAIVGEDEGVVIELQ